MSLVGGIFKDVLKLK